MNKPEDFIEWAKCYTAVVTNPINHTRYLGCKNPKGEYKEVCFTKGKKRWKSLIIFRIKVFLFKIAHPYWKFKAR